MEVSRQLRLTQPDKNGLVQIQMPCHWSGERLRFSTGQQCLPKHWDARRSQVRERPDAYASDINQVLNDYEAARAARGRLPGAGARGRQAPAYDGRARTALGG